MITVNENQFKEDVAQIQRKFETLTKGMGQRKPMFDRVGIQVTNEIMKNFKEEGNDGTRWSPLSEATINFRRKGKNKTNNPMMILQDTGKHLRNTFTHRSTNDDVRIGTTTEFAPRHEFGLGIPKRPMLPSKKKGLEIAVKVADNFLKEKIKEAKL